jgi:tetratricopeptide (TPR) repeat protein
MMSRTIRVLGLFAFVLATTGPSLAATWPVPRGASREPNPYRYDPAIWKTVPAEFLDDAPACILYASTTNFVESDGTIETITHEITRPGSRKSVEKLGEFRGISYTPAYQKLTLNEARLHKASGKVIEVEPRHVQLRDASTDYLVYNADKQLIISFPSLEVGDVLEVKWTIRGKNPEHHGQFFNRYSFGDPDYPVVRDEMRVRVPLNKPLKWACTGGKIEPKISDNPDGRLYTWSARNLKLLPRDEDRPSKEELRLQVASSTFTSWAEVGEWKRKLRAGCWECTANVKQTVAEATRNLKTPEEKARALAYWVRRNIRYLSSGATHDYTPHVPGEVLANRQGDCKDTSQLLAVMLREAGLPAALVTLGVMDDGQVLEDVPSPWGTHGILLVTIDGKDHWIDTTATLSAWDFLPRTCRDRLCYVTDEKGIRLKRTPKLGPDDNRFEVTTEVTIAADGSTRASRNEAYYNLGALNQRDRWLEVPIGEQRRQTAAKLLDSNTQSRLHRLTIDEEALRDFDRPVRATVEYTIPGQFSNKERETSFTDSRVWSYLLAYHVDPDRTLPMELSAPIDSRHAYLVKTPAGFEFDGLPRPRVVRSKWGSFTRTVAWIGDGFRNIRINYHLRLEKTRVEPTDFEEFRRFHKDVNDAYRVWLSLERTWRRKDLAEMEAVAWLAPEDSAAATMLAEQYLHLGDRTEAQRVLKRARHYKPDDVGLLELSVKAASTPESAEKMQRELVSRRLQDPTQAIALAAMLIDRGKPALAEPLLTALAETAPPAVRGVACYQLARAALYQEKAAAALDHLEKAALFEGGKSHLAAVEMLRGRAYESLKRPVDALKAYQKACKEDPKAEDSLLAVIQTALAQNERGVAGEHLRRYAAQAGDRIASLNRAADFALRLGWQQEAYDLADRARDLGFNESTQRILGLVHLQRGEPDKALFHLQRADATPQVLEGLIRASLALGKVQTAEREARRIASIPQPSDELKQARDRVQAIVNRREELLKLLAADADKRNKWISSLDYLACAEEARRLKRSPGRVEALAAMPELELGPVLAFRALLMLERGRLRDALPLTEKAIRLSPQDARGWYVRGKVRLERMAIGAIADLQKAAELSGNKDAEILQALAEARQAAGSEGK